MCGNKQRKKVLTRSKNKNYRTFIRLKVKGDENRKLLAFHAKSYKDSSPTQHEANKNHQLYV
jgi:hypothetical protein